MEVKRKTAAQHSAYAQATLQIQAALDTLQSQDCAAAITEALLMCKHAPQEIAQKVDSNIWSHYRG